MRKQTKKVKDLEFRKEFLNLFMSIMSIKEKKISWAAAVLRSRCSAKRGWSTSHGTDRRDVGKGNFHAFDVLWKMDSVKEKR